MSDLQNEGAFGDPSVERALDMAADVIFPENQAGFHTVLEIARIVSETGDPAARDAVCAAVIYYINNTLYGKKEWRENPVLLDDVERWVEIGFNHGVRESVFELRMLDEFENDSSLLSGVSPPVRLYYMASALFMAETAKKLVSGEMIADSDVLEADSRAMVMIQSAAAIREIFRNRCQPLEEKLDKALDASGSAMKTHVENQKTAYIQQYKYLS